MNQGCVKRILCDVERKLVDGKNKGKSKSKIVGGRYPDLETAAPVLKYTQIVLEASHSTRASTAFLELKAIDT